VVVAREFGDERDHVAEFHVFANVSFHVSTPVCAELRHRFHA
jgi:hypothetical protein